MSHTEQLPLFDEHQGGRQPVLDRAAFESATHHQLDEHSWITHVHGLVGGHFELLRQLGALAWEQRSRWMDSGGASVTFTPQGGDVLIMHGRCQRDWKHCVPKQKPAAGGRMSLNFNSKAQVLATLGR
jgi:hypothetical protein